MIYPAVRRSLELSAAMAGCLGLALLLPPFWLAYRIRSKGSVFYRQERVGLKGRPFIIYKIRTMVQNAEKDGRPVWATRGDRRVSRTGRALRAARLDELPQCFNILKGEMSLIGPRPERPLFVDLLTAANPDYPRRHEIKPGLTGWAQVGCGYGASIEDSMIKLGHDLYYLDHRGPALDMRILARTILVVLRLEGL